MMSSLPDSSGKGLHQKCDRLEQHQQGHLALVSACFSSTKGLLLLYDVMDSVCS